MVQTEALVQQGGQSSVEEGSEKCDNYNILLIYKIYKMILENKIDCINCNF